MLLLRCPHCATVFDAGSAGAGALVGCPSCRRPCQVPKFVAAVPVPAPPPAPPPVQQLPPVEHPVLEVPPELRLADDDKDNGPAPPPPAPPADSAVELEVLAITPDLRLEEEPPAREQPQRQEEPPVLEVVNIAPNLQLDDPPPTPPPNSPPPAVEPPQPPSEEEEIPEVQLVEEDDFEVLEEVPRKKRRRPRTVDVSYYRGTTRGLDTVNLGLGFHYARIVAMLASIAMLLLALVLGLLTMTFSAGGSQYDSASRASARAAVMGVSLVVFFFALVNILVSFLAPILGFVGTLLCLHVPEKARSRGLLIASLTLDVSAVFMGLLLGLIALLSEGESSAGLRMILPFILSSVAWLLFMMFLRRLSFYVDEEKLAEEASEIMTRGIIILALSPFVIFTVVGVAAVGRLLGLILATIVLLFSVYYFFGFLRRQLDLIGSLRQVIASRF